MVAGVGREPVRAQGLERVRGALLVGVSCVGLTVAGALLPAGEAAAQAVAPGFDANQLARNDDGSTGAVALPFAANFFGTTYSQVFVNNNGNVTFGQSLGQFTPVGLGSGYTGPPIIAPFFADVDTRNPASGVTSYGNGTYNGQTAFGVTWPNVGYFSNRVDKTNTFQLILAGRQDTGAGNFDIYFNYNRIQFETGDASGGTNGLGGTSASAGYSAGTGAAGTFLELPGSLVNGALLDGGPNALATGGNGTVPGQFLFPVRNGTVVFARSCGAGDNASTTTVANCGPNRVYDGGIFYTPLNTFTLNVLDNTTINAGATGSAVMVMPTSATAGVTVNVNASATINAPAGAGIEIDGGRYAGPATVTTLGRITAGTVGILARNGLGTLAVTNGGTITAPVGIIGVYAANTALTNSGTITGAIGAATLSSNAAVTNSGTVAFREAGLAAYGTEAVSVVNTGTLTYGADIAAIPSRVRGQLPGITDIGQEFSRFGGTILSDGVTQPFPGIGIAALGGNAAVTNAGTITAQAVGIAAVAAPRGEGAGSRSLSILNTGAITANGVGVFARTLNGNLKLANSGSIIAALGIDAAAAGPTTGASAALLTIGNSGSITGTSGYAVNTAQSALATRLDNAGTITGGVLLSNGSTFTNSGRFATALTSNFGGGSLDNTGVVALGSQTATFANLSRVTNAGTLDLRTPTASGQLTIAGDYVGRNGTLLVNTSSQTGGADRLVITGAASGTTGVLVNNLTPTTPFTTSPVVVQTGTTLNANAFTLAGTQNFGTLEAVLVRSDLAGGGSTIAVGAVPNAVGLSAPTAVIAARSISTQGGTAVLDRVTEVRSALQTGQTSIPQALQYNGLSQYSALVSKDPIAPNLAPPPPETKSRPAIWARGFGDLERRTGSTSFTFAGNNFFRDLGYNQSTAGFLGGADVVMSGLTKPDDGLILGVMAGYTTSSVRLNRGAGQQDYDGGTVGVYGTYLNGPWFVDALFKVDLLGLDIVGPLLRQSTGLQNYNFTTNVGYRVQLDNNVYVEPTAGLEYISTHFDQQARFTATGVPLVDGDALRGRIGARVGTEFVQDNIRIEPSITGYVYTVLTESGLSGAFTGGIASVSGLRDQGKARGEVQASINFFNLKTGLSGFIRGDFRVGEDLVAGGGRAGLRYQFSSF